jgi:hypothetical protein
MGGKGEDLVFEIDSDYVDFISGLIQAFQFLLPILF